MEVMNCSFCAPFYPLTQEKGLFKWHGLQRINMVTLPYLFCYCFYFFSTLKKREIECLRKIQLVKICRIHCLEPNLKFRLLIAITHKDMIRIFTALKILNLTLLLK